MQKSNPKIKKQSNALQKKEALRKEKQLAKEIAMYDEALQKEIKEYEALTAKMIEIKQAQASSLTDLEMYIAFNQHLGRSILQNQDLDIQPQDEPGINGIFESFAAIKKKIKTHAPELTETLPQITEIAVKIEQESEALNQLMLIKNSIHFIQKAHEIPDDIRNDFRDLVVTICNVYHPLMQPCMKEIISNNPVFANFQTMLQDKNYKPIIAAYYEAKNGAQNKLTKHKSKKKKKDGIVFEQPDEYKQWDKDLYDKLQRAQAKKSNAKDDDNNPYIIANSINSLEEKITKIKNNKEQLTKPMNKPVEEKINQWGLNLHSSIEHLPPENQKEIVEQISQFVAKSKHALKDKHKIGKKIGMGNFIQEEKKTTDSYGAKLIKETDELNQKLKQHLAEKETLNVKKEILNQERDKLIQEKNEFYKEAEEMRQLEKRGLGPVESSSPQNKKIGMRNFIEEEKQPQEERVREPIKETSQIHCKAQDQLAKKQTIDFIQKLTVFTNETLKKELADNNIDIIADKLNSMKIITAAAGTQLKQIAELFTNLIIEQEELLNLQKSKAIHNTLLKINTWLGIHTKEEIPMKLHARNLLAMLLQLEQKQFIISCYEFFTITQKTDIAKIIAFIKNKSLELTLGHEKAAEQKLQEEQQILEARIPLSRWQEVVNAQSNHNDSQEYEIIELKPLFEEL
jgi:hypothetical protein